MGKHTIRFDHKIKSKMGFMLGVYIKTATSDGWRTSMKPINVNKFHGMLCHANQETTRRTAEYLGFRLAGKWYDCEACAIGKMKQKPFNKIPNQQCESKIGERFGMDSTSTKATSLGGKNTWNMKMDYGSNFIKGHFLI